MSKNVLVGVDGLAREAENLWVGVDGKARRVKSAYVGVDGIARKFWPRIVYVWNKYNIDINYTYKWYRATIETTLVNNGAWYATEISSTFINYYWIHSDSFSVNENWFDLGSPTRRYTISTKPSSGTTEDRSFIDTYGFVIPSRSYATTSKTIYEINSNSEFAVSNMSGKYHYNIKPYRIIENTGYITVTSDKRNDYPDNNQIGDYFYTYVGSETSNSRGSYIGKVYSEQSNAYPKNGIQGNYWYVYQGTQG